MLQSEESNIEVKVVNLEKQLTLVQKELHEFKLEFERFARYKCFMNDRADGLSITIGLLLLVGGLVSGVMLYLN